MSSRRLVLPCVTLLLFELNACGLLIELPELEQDSPITRDDDDSDSGSGGAPSGGVSSGGAPVRPCLDDCGSGGRASGGRPQASGGEGGTIIQEPEPPDPCDRDGDTHLARGECGGDDCDDDDPKVRPSQTQYFSVPSSNPDVGFDYDCDGQSTRDPSQPLLSCPGLLVCPNSSTQGFHGTLPTCGETGSWGACKLQHLLGLGLTCSNDPITTLPMRCR